jgi:O-antigen/teichoic acid export membrane protein
MTLKDKAVKGVFWSVAERWSAQLLSTVVFLILVRLLGPQDFGLVALAMVFIAFAGIFVEAGFSQSIVQREDLQKGHLDTAFWSTIGLALLLGSIMFVLAPMIAGVLKEPELRDVVRALSPVFLFSALSSTQSAILRRDFRFKSLGVRTVVANLCGGVTGIICALAGLGVWSLVAQTLVGSVVGVLILWWTSPWRPGREVSMQSFRELFSFGVNITGISILNFFNKKADRFLIGTFLGTAALGYYTIARRFTEMAADLLLSPISKVALPAFARMQSDRPRLRDAFYRITKVTSAISSPVFVGMILVAPDFIPVVVGPQWEVSVPVLQLLAGVGLTWGLTFLALPSMLAVGYSRAAAGFHLINTTANVIGFAIAVQWGIVAVAAAFLVRGILLAPLPFWFMHRHLGIRYGRILKDALGVGLSLLLMTATCLTTEFLLAESADWIRLIATVAGGAVAYLTGLVLFDRGLLAEARAILKVR